ncbi:steroid 5-alpha reductase family enzyme [Acetoanaerobium pronyense]|uniref:Steroid 5-alpha reductase family enzyme n=1 Tax=Acetoanaerobium pronyense TaxID=1482736 RepID=A0ABS4KG84_9FIRM|nr:DUF1295 domain-containing protein [Acetoanaerobium pronyense]MBP2026753.1 steroid 5-alpha reductase family enzyme [Acetoanaerobium pronyense]
MILESIIVIFIYFLCFFIVGTYIKNNSIVDMGWGIGFVIVAWYTTLRTLNLYTSNLVITILITIWGLRLFYHIIKRNWGKPEDFRYANWRKEWGKLVIPRAFLQIYMLQGVFMFIVALPIILLNSENQSTFTIFGFVGLLIWTIGFFFESVGDYQLKVFKSNPENKGKIMDQGLWKYSRHPNYFGEATMWWGIAVIAFSSGASIASFISPITITYLLLFVSGVPMLEKSFAKRPGYKEYKEVTPVFFPWFPKKSK